MSREEIDALMAKLDADVTARQVSMPDEEAALRMLMEAYLRLKELGWNDAMYCPKDGSQFLAIEVGSTGQHRCQYMGDWTTGSYWILEGGDLWPSRPVLFKRYHSEGDQPCES